MTKRTTTLEVLDEYFKKSGSILSAVEYQRKQDTPIRFRVVQQLFGSWPRMERYIMARREETFEVTNVDDVLAANNKRQVEFESVWRRASEDQNAKAELEAKAQAVAEVLTANAATAAGANANKIAIGGPLPKEQPKLELGGATVNIHPETLQRTVIDTQPEVVKVVLHGGYDDGIGMTPVQLKDAMKSGEFTTTSEVAKGEVDHGNVTNGLATSAPSIASANGLGAQEETAAPTK